MTEAADSHWIAVDWGTSNLRAWKMAPDGTPIEGRDSPKGMGALDPDAFEPTFLDLAGDWLPENRTTVAVACGMVGARQGWVEAAYAAVPCPPHDLTRFVRAPVRDRRLSFQIIPGLSQASPADVMRGEETQIAGLLHRRPKFDGVLCLPGTHTKWAHISAGEVVSFTTYMSGEIFALLSGQSVLRHSVQSDGWSDEDFAEAVEEILSHPERLAARLFGIRAGSLLSGLTPDRARARLSGCLIGLELAGSKPHWLGRDVVLVGSEALSSRYARALALCGLSAETANATELTLAGLTAAHAHLTREGTPL